MGRSLKTVGLALCLGLSVNWLAPMARAEGVPVEQANDDQKEQARVAFTEARKAFDDRRFVDALRSFRASFDIVASPNTHLMIGHTERELGREAEAYATFEAVAEQAEAAMASDEKYRKTAQIAREELGKLRGSVGLVTIEVRGADEGATLSVEGKEVDKNRWGKPIAVTPGKVPVVLSAGGKSAVREVTIAAGGTETLAIAPSSSSTPAPNGPDPVPPSPDKESEGGPPEWMFIGGIAAAGVGVVGFALAGVFGGLALEKHNELEEACGESPCPARQDDIDQGRTFQTASNVMIVVGAVFVAAGAGLFTYYMVADQGEEEAAITLGPGSIGVRGTF